MRAQPPTERERKGKSTVVKERERNFKFFIESPFHDKYCCNETTNTTLKPLTFLITMFNMVSKHMPVIQ